MYCVALYCIVLYCAALFLITRFIFCYLVGEQRMRTNEDQLQMRTVFTECDLISAEIQNIGADGQISLHTRSLKYGKLENGQLIIVPSTLLKRLPQHYISFPWGIDCILGRNGFIWITRTYLLLHLFFLL